MLPPNTDDLTLWTDPVMRYAMNSIAVSVGAGIVALAAFLLP